MQDKYIDLLINNQNKYSKEDTQNLYSKQDYEDWFSKFDPLHPAKRIEENMAALLSSGLTTGLSIACGTEKGVQYYNLGNTGQKENIVTEKTLIDLASVTKIFTCIAYLMINESIGVKLSAPVKYYSDKFKNIKQLSLLEIINYSKGLKTEKRIDDAETFEEAHFLLNNIKLSNAMAPQYSDMGAMVLGELFEDIVSMPLSDFMRREIFDKFHMQTSMFRVPEKDKINCMDYDNEYRFFHNKLYRLNNPAGLVHDRKAKILSEKFPFVGHAGIFSTGVDIASFGQHLLSGDIISRESLYKIGSAKYQASSFGKQRFGLLCYAKNPVRHMSEVPHQLSGNAFGISGFTGCSFLIDPMNKLFVFIGGNRLNNRLSKSDLDFRGLHNNVLSYKGQNYIVSQNYVYEKDKLQEELLLSLLWK